MYKYIILFIITVYHLSSKIYSCVNVNDLCVACLHPYLATTDTPESSDSGLAVPQESSRQEPPPPPTEEPQSQILSSLRLENQLLRSEVASLNQEMASVIQRAKDLQDGERKDKTGAMTTFEICPCSDSVALLQN